MRLAIVGYGKAARDKHIPAVTATPGIDLVAIASPNGGLDGIPWFPTLEALLASDTDFDAVALCTPPQTRHHQAALALEAGLHVLLEKPPGATVSEVTDLSDIARRTNQTLFATWHSRFARGVEHARKLIDTNGAKSIEIAWRENVHVWHPGQDWIWQPGGLGVFELGISAISILTEIVPEKLVVTAAELSIPSNRDKPIAANVSLVGDSGLAVTAIFDFRQKRDEMWEIEVKSDTGIFALSHGGSVLTMDGRILAAGPLHKYRGIYQRFLELVQTGTSDVDTAPLAHVEEAFRVGRRIAVEPFED